MKQTYQSPVLLLLVFALSSPIASISGMSETADDDLGNYNPDLGWGGLGG